MGGRFRGSFGQGDDSGPNRLALAELVITTVGQAERDTVRVTHEKSTVTDDGVEIAFDDAGQGVPVIWLHGITDDRTSWGPITSRLTDKMRCIRVDLRGHGRSANQGPYAAGFVSDLAAVIRATGATSPVIVGHSLGGVVATLAASMGLTGSVVCVDQPLKLGSFTELVQRDAVRLRDPATYADTLMAEKLELGMGLVPTALFRELERATRNSNQNVVLDAWRPVLDGDLDGITATERALEDALRMIDVPYLALHGRPVEAGYEQWFEATNPAAKFEYWPGLGHWLHLVNPCRFAGRVTQFIEEAAPPQRL